MTFYNFTENNELTSISTHKSCNSHNMISNLYGFDNKNIGFVSYIRKKQLQIINLNIKRYYFEIYQKGTLGNCIKLYQYVYIDFPALEQLNFQETNTILINIDVMITKTDMIVSETQITYVYDLANAC
jgi:hypothetical protein